MLAPLPRALWSHNESSGLKISLSNELSVVDFPNLIYADLFRQPLAGEGRVAPCISSMNSGKGLRFFQTRTR